MSVRLGGLRQWRALGWSAALALAAIQPAVAQDPAPIASRGRRSVEASDPGDPGATRARRAPAAVVRATPRTLHVVTVPVPEAFRPAGGQWRFVGGELAPVLGERAGRFTSAVDQLLFTVRIPAGAPAGEQEIGVVRFEGAGLPTTEAPIVLDVQIVRRVYVTAVLPTPLARGGEAATVRFEVHNGGNAPDSLQLRPIPTTDWRVLGPAESMLVLAPGQRSIVPVRVAVPDDAGATTWGIRLQVLRGADVVAEAEAPIEVSPVAAGAALGPIVTATAVSAPGTQEGLAGWGVRVSGRVTEDITLDAQTAQADRLTPLGLTAMTRVGFFPVPLSAALSGSGWRVAGGLTGLNLSDLSGLGVTGTGVTATIDREALSLQAVAARPWTGAASATAGGLYAARLTVPEGSRRWSLAHANLDEAGAFGRQLVATTVGLATPTPLGGTLSTEVGHRAHRAGQGIGAAADWRASWDDTDLLVRVGRAPGGTSAFGRATEDVSASTSRRFGNGFEFGIGGFRVLDESPTGGTLRNFGVQVTPRARLGERTWIGLEGRTTGFEARGSSLGFRDRDVQLGADLQHQFRGGLSFTSQMLASRIRRETVLDGGRTFETEAPRGQVRAALAQDASWGTAEATLLVERSGAGSGLPPSQTAIGVRVHNLQPVPAWPSLRVGVDLQRLDVGTSVRALVARADARMLLPGGFRLQAAVERNPLLAVFGGDVVVAALRLERSFGVPLPTLVPARGLVFVDANGNGRRDPQEAGLAGAVVRAGDQRVIADGNGRFRPGAASARDVTVDDRSLPAGWSIGAVTRDPATGVVREVAVVPGASVEISLEVVATDDGFERVQGLDDLDVYATDADGRAWMAVPRGGQRWSLADLPPGTYQLAISSERLPEPVVIRGAAPTFRIDGRSAPAPIVLRVGPRPVRFVPLSTPAADREVMPPSPAAAPAPTSPAPAEVALPAARARWLIPMPTVSTAGTSHAVLPPPPELLSRLPRITIPKGATLWGLSKRYYGSGRKYPRLQQLNPQIRNPHRIYAGRTLTRPLPK